SECRPHFPENCDGVSDKKVAVRVADPDRGHSSVEQLSTESEGSRKELTLLHLRGLDHRNTPEATNSVLCHDRPYIPSVAAFFQLQDCEVHRIQNDGGCRVLCEPDLGDRVADQIDSSPIALLEFV